MSILYRVQAYQAPLGVFPALFIQYNISYKNGTGATPNEQTLLCEWALEKKSSV